MTMHIYAPRPSKYTLESNQFAPEVWYLYHFCWYLEGPGKWIKDGDINMYIYIIYI